MPSVVNLTSILKDAMQEEQKTQRLYFNNNFEKRRWEYSDGVNVGYDEVTDAGLTSHFAIYLRKKNSSEEAIKKQAKASIEFEEAAERI